MLYNEVGRNCQMIGLDPFMGFLHTERYGKPSLVLDLVEELRVHIVDSTVIPLFVRKLLNAQDIEIKDGKALLNQKAKHLVIKMVYERLYQKVSYRGHQMRVRTALKNHARNFAHYLVGKKREYKPFLLYDFGVNIPGYIQNQKR